MSVLPDQQTIEVKCGAEDIEVLTISRTTLTWMNKNKIGKASGMYPNDVESIAFSTCPWEGLVTEYIFTHAGIADWTCPLCRTTHTRELR